MSSIDTTPTVDVIDAFDVSNEQELLALTNLFYSQLVDLIRMALVQRKDLRRGEIIDFISEKIFGLEETKLDNKLDEVLFAMGEFIDVPEDVRDRVLFLRQFALRFIVSDKERAQEMREHLRKLSR